MALCLPCYKVSLFIKLARSSNFRLYVEIKEWENSNSNNRTLSTNVPYCTHTMDNQELVTHGPVVALLKS